jgi:hypothetical protein
MPLDFWNHTININRIPHPNNISIFDERLLTVISKQEDKLIFFLAVNLFLVTFVLQKKYFFQRL